MKKNWNWRLWVGFLCVLAGFLTYFFFAQFPATRDFPWVNFLIFGAGAIFLVTGLMRAFRRPDAYRGKVLGPVLTVLSLLIFGFFALGLFYFARQLPSAAGAPHVGDKAPDFTLLDQNDKQVALSELLSSSTAGGKPGGAILIFYRGHW